MNLKIKIKKESSFILPEILLSINFFLNFGPYPVVDNIFCCLQALSHLPPIYLASTCTCNSLSRKSIFHEKRGAACRRGLQHYRPLTLPFKFKFFFLNKCSESKNVKKWERKIRMSIDTIANIFLNLYLTIYKKIPENRNNSLKILFFVFYTLRNVVKLKYSGKAWKNIPFLTAKKGYIYHIEYEI